MLRVIVHALHIGMEMDFTEAQREGELLVGRDVLIAQDNDLVAQPGIVDFVEDIVFERHQVDARERGGPPS